MKGEHTIQNGAHTLDCESTPSLACSNNALPRAGKVSLRHRPRLPLSTWCGPESHFSKCHHGRSGAPNRLMWAAQVHACLRLPPVWKGLYLNVQDGTLVVQKTAGRFVTSASDWKLFNKEVPKVLKEHFDKGYKIVVFRCDTSSSQGVD